MIHISRKLGHKVSSGALALLLGAVAAIGCGGSGSVIGGTTGGTTGGGGAAALTGTVQVPQSQIAAHSAALKQVTRDGGLVALDGATVELHKVSDDSVAASTTTDSAGTYSFTSVDANTDYIIVATKTIGSANFTLKAVVSIGADNTTTKTRDLDADTTVAAETAQSQYTNLKALNPGFDASLQDLAGELETKRKEGNAAAPDLTNSDEVKQAGDDLFKAQTPDGAFNGSYAGDNQGEFTVRISEGNFMIFMAVKNQTTVLDSDSGIAGKNKNAVLIGTVDENGLVNVAGDNDLTITGVLVGDLGIGTWKNGAGEKGTWKISKVKEDTAPLSGFYGGVADGEAPGEGGHFVFVVKPDNSLFFEGVTSDGSFKVHGTGTVAADGSFSISYSTGDSRSGTATGTIEEGFLTISFEFDNGDFWSFSAEKAFDPVSFVG